jgi:cytochrome c biogenesis protein CcdA
LRPRPTNVLAIVSLVLSLVSYCVLPIVGAIAGIITGHIAKRQIRETGEEGSGLATAGIVLGWIHIGLFVLAAAAAIAFAIAGATLIEHSRPVPTESVIPGEPAPSVSVPSISPT